MPYSADTDLTNDIITQTELVQLTDDEGLGAVNAQRTAAARARIDELIDGHLRAGGYTLPLAVTPPILKSLSLDGTVYYLWERKKKHNMPDGMKEKIKGIMALLGRIQKRQILIGADAAVESPAGNYKTNKTSEDRVFTKDKLDTY
ncbi:MAG: DUF1320 domain-containing protein [Nitrospirae bacterium]|nr:DUF1320 domain-containing protein [Nitrospirota bacterium]